MPRPGADFDPSDVGPAGMWLPVRPEYERIVATPRRLSPGCRGAPSASNCRARGPNCNSYDSRPSAESFEIRRPASAFRLRKTGCSASGLKKKSSVFSKRDPSRRTPSPKRRSSSICWARSRRRLALRSGGRNTPSQPASSSARRRAPAEPEPAGRDGSGPALPGRAGNSRGRLGQCRQRNQPRRIHPPAAAHRLHTLGRSMGVSLTLAFPRPRGRCESLQHSTARSALLGGRPLRPGFRTRRSADGGRRNAGAWPTVTSVPTLYLSIRGAEFTSICHLAS